MIGGFRSFKVHRNRRLTGRRRFRPITIGWRGQDVLIVVEVEEEGEVGWDRGMTKEWTGECERWWRRAAWEDVAPVEKAQP